jgi:hypothetical protein
MSRELALAFAAAGFPDFPVDVFWDDERKRWRKLPCIKEWERRATTNPTLIKMWWNKWPCAMPGIPPGRINKVVVDADRHGGSDGVELFHELDRERGPFPPHPVVVTKSGGEHHWFAQPVSPIRWAKWAGGEVLGHGRFVVGYAVPQGECPELPGLFRQGAVAEDTRPFKNHHGPLMIGAAAGEIPKPLYLAVKKCVPLSARVTRHHQRRIIGILSILTRLCGERRRAGCVSDDQLWPWSRSNH